MSDKKYESIWWYTTLLMFLLMILNNFVMKIEILNVIIAAVYIVFMGIVKIKHKKLKQVQRIELTIKKNVIIFVASGCVGLIMYEIREHTSLTTATIILVVFIAVCLMLEVIWKRYIKKREQE
ncbi:MULTISPECIES: hypothetical protein [Bacillus]|uniref:Uncharacterized protein n=1 Tax=Bacillus glycinifermentans TaxID=1664069 RepID=A0A0T6BNP6_9BACI|nr:MULTISPECIES: hypothetical protein [Bacillus]KRT93098.1 hypothetical protein AB447_203960 [Bacillus glycinifermentans]MEC0341921.1 hypothetical protein [Bacillus sonorensis]MEC0457393.1 hypothetical protein [Bacillus sonorensis]MEC0487909.1 hypothetical protein [Bacillus glycinifermentans]MEC0530812.1 hypothetical protein [Bacillus sonorensis]